MTSVQQLDNTDVFKVKTDAKKVGNIKYNNDTVTTSMYYDEYGVIYSPIDNDSVAVYAYAPGIIIGTTQSLSITIPSFIRYNTSTWRVTSIVAHAFTFADKYFALRKVSVPENIKISEISGIPKVIRITANTSVANLGKLKTADIKELDRAALIALAKTRISALKSKDASWIENINQITPKLSSKQARIFGEAKVAEIEAPVAAVTAAATVAATASVKVNLTAMNNIVVKGMSVKNTTIKFEGLSSLLVLVTDGAIDTGSARINNIGNRLFSVAASTRSVINGLAANATPSNHALTTISQNVLDAMVSYLDDSDKASSSAQVISQSIASLRSMQSANLDLGLTYIITSLESINENIQTLISGNTLVL